MDTLTAERGAAAARENTAKANLWTARASRVPLPLDVSMESLRLSWVKAALITVHKNVDDCLGASNFFALGFSLPSTTDLTLLVPLCLETIMQM